MLLRGLGELFGLHVVEVRLTAQVHVAATWFHIPETRVGLHVAEAWAHLTDDWVHLNEARYIQVSGTCNHAGNVGVACVHIAEVRVASASFSGAD